MRQTVFRSYFSNTYSITMHDSYNEVAVNSCSCSELLMRYSHTLLHLRLYGPILYPGEDSVCSYLSRFCVE